MVSFPEGKQEKPGKLDGSAGGGSNLEGNPCAALLEEISTHIPPQQYETWFRNLPMHFLAPDQLVITAANRFSKTWIERKFADLIRSSAQAVFGVEPRIEIQVHAEAASTATATVEAPPVELPPPAPRDYEPDDPVPLILRGRMSSRPAERKFSTPINRDYTFANFVIGPSNRLAHAAALGVTESPGRSYNPLFLYGGVGLGKTHLLHAIVHRMEETTPGVRVTYMTSEAFSNGLLAAIERGEADEFRKGLRSTDVLIVDDIQFISRKDRAQEEFFHTFNALVTEAKQVVLTSDCFPKEIPGLKERLISRFKMGLITKIETPDFETRVAIVHRKAQARGRDVSEAVAEYIANHIVNNVREIEGALIRLFSMASLHRSPDDPAGPPITLDLARMALQDLVREENFQRVVAISEIQKAVSLYYDVKLSEIASEKRNRTISLARQVCMYLARQLTHCSLQEIGAFIGGRDHATVLYAVEKIADLIKKDARIEADLKLLQNRIMATRSAL